MIFLSPVTKQALQYIQPHMTVSLGGGRHMQSLADAIAAAVITDLRITSPSELTRAYCRERHLPTIAQPNHIDVAFDGCDSADADLNLLKSNGGIHTQEKVYAQLAQSYIILAPSTRVQHQLDPQVPLCLEVVPACAALVGQFAAGLGLKVQQRVAANYAGYVYTSQGNVLLDCHAADWTNIAQIADQLSRFNGVVSTSYFANLTSCILAEAADGTVTVIKKGDLK
ncbi:ribose-5-phosphate isomerase A [Schleiferilactobacillus perolens]|uniref:ribose-5-phosphate isomerase n=1 Tax=Schleiferilactobacillus perolens DSM 12744 TaxID=1423792 RepID=A0A0R1MYI0_9LACO|nr:ribose 5-phosphate isomerase [Schleiferilactobacillus perolens DSM 12744]